MGDDQIGPEPSEHADTVISLAELPSCGVEQGADVASKALWGAVIQVIGYVRDGKTGVLEEPRGTD